MRPGALYCSIVIGLCVVLYIVGAATNHCGDQKDSHFGSSDYSYGLYKSEYYYSSSLYSVDSTCTWQNDCSCEFNSNGNTVNFQFFDKNSSTCHKFVAARAFIILAIIFGGIATIVMLAFSFKSRWGYHNTVATGLNKFSALFGLICMALIISVNNDINDNLSQNSPQYKLNYSFGLITAAWIIQLFAGCFFHVNSK